MLRSLIYRILSKRRSENRSQSSTSNLDTSSSSSSGCGFVPKGTYDVFLSFRGKDTRTGFVGHLYEALKAKGIHTFRDDKRLESGKPITSELHKAIDDSKIAIVVFSRTYASSSWCLDELVRIVESENKIIIPVFYDVPASDIRKQKNAVEQALAKLETRDHKDKIPKWKEALTRAANFSGVDVPNTANGDESECIKKIVTKVFDKLRLTVPNSRKDLVGMERRVDKVISMLKMESNCVRMVGIWGMGGAGKTTIASDIFHKISNSYNASCFLQIDASERWDGEYLKQLQKTLLSKILKLDNIDISHTDYGISLLKDKLRFMKVLIVVDNVWHIEQLTALAIERESFGDGSRVIITTRDSHLLHNVDEQYEVDMLNKDEGIQVFCWHAFKTSNPREDFIDLSLKAIKYAGGLPLALQVLGSHLRGFKNLEEWSTELRKLKKVPNSKIDSILKISYDGLGSMEKRIFLDIACFFHGIEKDDVIRKLDSLDLHPQSGIVLLEAKSLVSIDLFNRLNMHDLVQEMGRNIVRRDHPGSRLWEDEEIVDAMNGDLECERVEAIVARGNYRRRLELNISNEAFMRMNKLRLFVLEGLIECPKPPDYLPRDLECLRWINYSSHSLPKNFEGRKLVELVLRISDIVELISGEQMLKKLRILDLSHSQRIRQSPDFSKLPCLEVLRLHHCRNLEEVHSSFGVHDKLVTVDMSCCNNIKTLPESLQMESLKCLYLDFCMNLEKFPEIEGNNITTILEELDLSGTGISGLPSSAKNLSNLRRLDLSDCKNLELEEFKSVDDYIIDTLSSIVAIRALEDDDDDDDVGSSFRILFTLPSFPQLTHLNLKKCNLSHLAIPEHCLPSLHELDISENPMLFELAISEECLSSLRLIDFQLSRISLFFRRRKRAEPISQNLFNQVKCRGPMLSLLSSTCEDENIVDWEVLSRVLHERDSALTIRMSRSEIPKWFKHQFSSELLSTCEVTVPPPSSKFRGLAIFLCMPFGENMVSYINIKYCCQKQPNKFLRGRDHHILFHYVPRSQLYRCCSSNFITGEQNCLVDVWFDYYRLDQNVLSVSDEKLPCFKWGIRMVFEDEYETENIMIKMSDFPYQGSSVFKERKPVKLLSVKNP